MKRIIIAVIAIVALLVGAYYAGVLPVMDMLGPDGYETQANWHNNFQGNPDKELFLQRIEKDLLLVIEVIFLMVSVKLLLYRGDISFRWEQVVLMRLNML